MPTPITTPIRKEIFSMNAILRKHISLVRRAWGTTLNPERIKEIDIILMISLISGSRKKLAVVGPIIMIMRARRIPKKRFTQKTLDISSRDISFF